MAQGLASWFALWHPRYRATLVQLLLAATLASVLAYAQNDLLGLLTQSLTASDASASEGAGTLGVLARLSASLRLGLPLLSLALFILVRMVTAGVEFWKAQTLGVLTIRSRVDLEAELLVHLLKKDEAFLSRHSSAETVNRLAVDLTRVSGRRTGAVDAWWAGLLLAGNLAFFVVKDWRLAAVALATCLVGALWSRRMAPPARAMDSAYLAQDDRVKSRFEDLLRAAPEIQVGRLYDKVRQRFAELQGPRTTTFLRYLLFSDLVRVGNILSALLAFVAMILVVLHQRRTGTSDAALAVVPVVIWAIPDLFRNATSLVFPNPESPMSRTSMERLLEYEAHEPEAPRPAAEPAPPVAAEAAPLRLDRVSYWHTSAEGALQGGVAEITTTLAPGKWTALVGGSGSGKSTVLKLLLGQLKPQEGAVLYGPARLDSLPASQRAAILTLMPQSPALLDTTILDNLLFGRPLAPGTPLSLSEADAEAVESLGLGRICRLKALDRTPRDPADYAEVARRIVELTRRLRERLRTVCGATVLPYEDGHGDLRHWVLECLIGGRCDRLRAVPLLLDPGAAGSLRPLVRSRLGAKLAELGRGVLRETRHLLAIPNYHIYAQLAPLPLDERLWRLRVAHAPLADKQPLAPREALPLATIGLSSSPAELASDPRSADWLRPGLKGEFPDEIARLKALLGTAWRPVLAEEVHPHLTWRENLIFGVVQATNSRASRMVDQAILEFIESEGLKAAFTRLGLEFEIGRQGAHLSGGQGQLLAIGRALLRRTPVLVLDEPTSALDPASRARVAALLQSWKAGRIVITTSNDTEFIREADEILVMDTGRLVASGTFRELGERSEAFRRMLRQP